MNLDKPEIHYHFPIYDIVSNCDWCEECGKKLHQYEESERIPRGEPYEPEDIPGCPF